MKYGKSGVECDADIVPGWFRYHGEAGKQMAATCPPHWSYNSGGNGWMRESCPQWQMDGSSGWPVSTLVNGAVSPSNTFKLEIVVNTMFTISMAHQITRAAATAVMIE